MVQSFNGNEQDFSKSSLKLIWPSVDFVNRCIDGYSAGGSLCLPAKNYQSKAFLKDNFYHYNASYFRDRVPPHIKTYFSFNDHVNTPDIKWMLLTSANMSKAAWGQLQKRNSQLMIRHFEIGVLFLPKDNKTICIGNFTEENSQRISFALPYQYKNLQKYSINTNPYHQPWIWDIEPPKTPITPTVIDLV